MSLPSTADPLLALRDATKSNTPITFVTSSDAPTESLANAAYILLGSSANGSEAKFSKSAPTRYSKLGAPHEFYTLEALYLAWALRALHGAEYMKQTREAGVAVGFVSVTERRGIVEWLEGQGAEDAGGRIAVIGVIGAQARGDEAKGENIAEFESIIPPGIPPPHSTAFALMLKSSTTKQQLSSTAATTTPSKTPSSAYPDIEVVRRIREQEVELKDRNTVLRGSKAGNFSALHTAYADKLKKMKESSKSHSSSGTNAYGVPNPSPSAGLGAGGVMQARKARKARINCQIMAEGAHLPEIRDVCWMDAEDDRHHFCDAGKSIRV
ncbi:hypothetical protein BJ138DRAFT_1103572 [Hygrophoropsis aurantiaca]|uniref:Uncharacterized protein n=1 Tax=Hygrophoropsis aurantiaca TaxID=72124 RepID=A0ACB8A585_9AGAM|nr:hypothetical protein BJ138DRAFT_1103572 [Hygrophoropsis aurantiaca]